MKPDKEPATPPGEPNDPAPAAEAKSLSQRSGLLQALGTGLAEVVPGLRLLDRDLVFEEGAEADLAGVDGVRRLVLVVIADEDVDRTTLHVIDTASYAARHAATIARHLTGGHVDPTLPPRTLVVDPHASVRLQERLGPFFESGIELYGLQSIRSAGGDRSYLQRLGVEWDPAGASGADATVSFVAALPPDLAELGGQVVARISRLDRDLVTEGRAGILSWILHDDPLVRLEVVGEGLRGSVGPDFDARAIAAEEDLDPLLELALARLVDLPGGGLSGGVLSGNGAPAEPLGPRPTSDRSRPILTDEEIDYFHG